jgi:hypothetical protein
MAGRSTDDVAATITAGRDLELRARATYRRSGVVQDGFGRHRGHGLLGRLRGRSAA